MNHGKRSFLSVLFASLMMIYTVRTVAIQPPKDIRAVVSVLDICGQSFVKNHVQRLQPIMFNTNTSLQSAFQVCSQGRTRFTQSTVHIVPQQVPVYSTCYSMNCDYVRWADEADAWIIKHTQHGVQNHMIYVLPNTTSCPWAGLGYTSCSTYPDYRCRVWINGVTADAMDTYFHELGHNLGLSHARTPSLEYGDASCAMGYCCWTRCYNAPHNEQLGWAAPLYVLHLEKYIPRGTTWTYILPAARSKEKSYLRIHTPTQWIYVEFRKRVTRSIDVGLPKSVSDTVNIYTTPTSNPLGSDTILQASLRNHSMTWKSREGIRILIAQKATITLNQTYVTIHVQW